MNKKNQNNLVTSRVLKSKYHEREKQKTIPLRKKTLNNLKITDLCPEEKIKIGELIRILQLRRIQNLQLQNDNQRLKEHIYHCESKLDQMKNDCLETQSQIANLKDKITSLKAMINLYEQKLTKNSENVKVSSSRNTMYTKGFQTQQITTRMESCQTLLIDHNQIGSQTDTQRDENFLFYRANSKSFEKIMKGVLQKNLQKKVLSDKDQSAEKSSSVIRSKFDNYHISSKNNFSDSSCESLGQIEQKWNLLKIKNQAELAISKQLNSINEFECSSPSKNDSSHASQNPIKIDAITLNRMIKKKDFSVTTLMKTEKMKQIKRDSHQVSYLKSPYFNRPQVDHSLLKPLTNQSYNDSRSKPSFRLNFYESGLSDMGSSLR